MPGQPTQKYPSSNPSPQRVIKRIAILVDGGFYRKRASKLFGKRNSEKAADELYRYCCAHAYPTKSTIYDIYRIFYYDGKPLERSIYNPIDKTYWKLGDEPWYHWMNTFLDELKRKRKMALRLGKVSDRNPYVLPYPKIKELANKSIEWKDIKPSDLSLAIEQKGVDMKIGVDIASLAFKKQVDQIVLISGDSDFVPAAKLARREGIDFILDPMGAQIPEDLHEHIDGLHSQIKRFAQEALLREAHEESKNPNEKEGNKSGTE